VNQPNVKYGTKLSADIEKTLTNAFIDNVKIQLSTHIRQGFGPDDQAWEIKNPFHHP